jgi:ABC-2 type transport system permease protein
MKTFLNLYRANLKEYVRDRMAVFWTMAFPIVFILIFGLIFSSGNARLTIDVAVINPDNDPISAQISEGFKQVPTFKLTQSADVAAELQALRLGQLDMVVVLPIGLSKSIGDKQTGNVQVYYDPSATTVAQAGLSILQEAFNIAERAINHTSPLFLIEPQQIQAKPLNQVDLLVPGILAMSLMQLGLFGTSQPLVALREQGVLRRLGATPLSRSTVLAAQVAFRFTLGVAQAVLILSLGNALFHVSIGDSLFVLVVVIALGILLFIALGFAVAGLAKSSESANGITQMINFPMMFLSGLFFPLSLLPTFLMPVAAILPLTYVADALRQVMVNAPSSTSLSTDVLVMGLWLAISLIGAVKLFKWD